MINFTKMHVLGNDYVFVDCTDNKNYISNPSVFSKNISNRNLGIGSNGLILLENSNISDFKIRTFNSDGSESELCGNGLLCVGKYVFDNKLTDKTSLKIETLAGIKDLELKVINNKVSTITVCLGEYKIFDEFELHVLDKTFNINPVFIGSPHSVIFLNNLNDIDIVKYAPIIENHKVFSNKTNIDFVQIINSNHIKIKTWERRVGLTPACSIGACASTVASFNRKFIYKNPVIELSSGNFQTYLDIKTNSVYLSGPAYTVFTGIHF